MNTSGVFPNIMGHLVVIARPDSLRDVVDEIKIRFPERKLLWANSYGGGMDLVLNRSPSVVLVHDNIPCAIEICRTIKTNSSLQDTQVVYFARDEDRLEDARPNYDLGYLVGSYNANQIANKIKS